MKKILLLLCLLNYGLFLMEVLMIGLQQVILVLLIKIRQILLKELVALSLLLNLAVKLLCLQL